MTEVNPAMDMALSKVEKFVFDAHGGKMSKDQLRFGAPWRHPPSLGNPSQCFKWTKLQLMDYVHSLVSTEFGVMFSFLLFFKLAQDFRGHPLVGTLYVGGTQHRAGDFLRI